MSAAPGAAVTEDALLGGRVSLKQPRTGYRAAIDPVLLAAAVQAQAGHHILDVGTGTGAAALCVARRIESCRVTGLEIQSDLASLARSNVEANDLEGRVDIVEGDLLQPPASLKPGSFDQVVANPPYLRADHGHAPEDAGRRMAETEDHADLGAWIGFALGMVRPKGAITLIHRADRLDDILVELRGRAGEAVIFPLWPKAAAAAKRVIVRARKGVATGTRLMPGLILHADDGAYTVEAQKVLSGQTGLNLG